jgi:hypothetical protein
MLSEIFGAYPQVKVIELLLTHQNIEYTKEEIAECTEISKDMLDAFWEQLEKYGIVKPTRKTENAQLYTANIDSEAMRSLKRFQYELAEIEIEEQIGLERRESKKEAVIV